MSSSLLASISSRDQSYGSPASMQSEQRRSVYVRQDDRNEMQSVDRLAAKRSLKKDKRVVASGMLRATPYMLTRDDHLIVSSGIQAQARKHV